LAFDRMRLRFKGSQPEPLLSEKAEAF